MLQINTNGYESPDSTYFRTSAAEPELERDENEQQVLKLVNGTGSRRSSWGQPGVTSTVILETEDLVAIHVGFFHKHGGSQFWRYYRFGGQEWAQVTWASLSDEDRTRVLIAHEDRSPGWAKAPGKLREDYKPPVMKVVTSYKLVRVVGEQMYSVYDGSIEYVIGKRLAEKAVNEHRGGYYSYPSAQGVEQSFFAGELFLPRFYNDSMTLALLECEISGTILEYDGRKYASTYLRPVKILKTFDYVPALQEVS